MQVVNDVVESFPTNPKYVKLGIIQEGLTDYIVFVDRFNGKVYIEEIVYTSAVRDRGNIITTQLRSVFDDKTWKELIDHAQNHNVITLDKLERICGQNARVVRKRAQDV